MYRYNNDVFVNLLKEYNTMLRRTRRLPGGRIITVEEMLASSWMHLSIGRAAIPLSIKEELDLRSTRTKELKVPEFVQYFGKLRAKSRESFTQKLYNELY